MKDFETFLLDDGYDKLFRMNGRLVKIEEAIELPNGEILLGVYFISDKNKLCDLANIKMPIHYHMLSEVEMSYYPEDNSYGE